MSSIHEECGVFGIYTDRQENVAETVYYGLFALQHRGQEGCGISVYTKGRIVTHKDLGLVGEVFTGNALKTLGEGSMALGHVRYGTTSVSSRINCQPLEVNHLDWHMALAQNGSLVNAEALRREMELGGAIFQTTTDTEIIAYVVTQERTARGSMEEAVSAAMNRLEGAYSMVVISQDKMIAARDKSGFRPLCYGVTPEGDYVVASESCALAAVSARFERDILPGEIVVFDKNGVRSIREHCGKNRQTLCVFEYIYFARPDSVVDGRSVHRARVNAGRYLARRFPAEADVVIGVPDSGLDAALGYAMESKIPLQMGFIKNKYIGRTFITPDSGSRRDQVKIKLSVIEETVRDKRVVLIDDSIVRGTTSNRIVSLLREAGAREVHMRVSAPPFIAPCYYGTDIDSKEHLIACNHSLEEINHLIGTDSLQYLDIADLLNIAGSDRSACFCSACFDENYPTAVPVERKKDVCES